MPKIRRVIKRGNAVHRYNVLRKFRIGSRRSNPRSALQMTNEELKDVLEQKTMHRYHPNARQVLVMRGVEV